MADLPICKIPGCGKKQHAHGYCSRHASKLRRHGDPLGGRAGSSPGEPLRWIEEHASYAGDDCLPWPFEIGRYGYGTVKEAGRKRVASRVMCERAHGPAPGTNFDAAHSCGNGHLGCTNPTHLSWKTRKGNVGDAIAHGTWKRGANDANAKLSDDDVREIRRLAGSMLQKDIAALFGVRQGQISRVISGVRWGWLT